MVLQNHNTEAKCQALLQFEKLVGPMLLPNMPLIMRLSALEFLVEVWLDVDVIAPSVRTYEVRRRGPVPAWCVSWGADPTLMLMCVCVCVQPFAHLLMAEAAKLRQPHPLVWLQGRPKKRVVPPKSKPSTAAPGVSKPRATNKLPPLSGRPPTMLASDTRPGQKPTAAQK